MSSEIRTVSGIFSLSELSVPSKKPAGLVSMRHVGIEVEVENCRSLSEPRHWRVIGDGSLRNNGAEILLDGPMCGARLVAALSNLSDTLRENPELVCSERTSVHVHVNVRDLTYKQVQNVLLIYIATESALYKMGGKMRYENIYCPGISSALEQMPLMRNFMKDSYHDFADACYNWCKYTGINMRSVPDIGTVEFRAHEGTLDVDRIHAWVNVLLSLVEYAKNNDRDQIMQDITLEPEHLLRTVYGDYTPQLMQDGDFLRYHKNNLINVTDLMTPATDFAYTRVERTSATPSGDVSDIIASLRSAVAAARAES